MAIPQEGDSTSRQCGLQNGSSIKWLSFHLFHCHATTFLRRVTMVVALHPFPLPYILVWVIWGYTCYTFAPLICSCTWGKPPWPPSAPSWGILLHQCYIPYGGACTECLQWRPRLFTWAVRAELVNNHTFSRKRSLMFLNTLSHYTKSQEVS